MSKQRTAIIKNCKVQAESCQYTSAGLYIWLKSAVWWNRGWNALPIIFGAFATYSFIENFYPVLASFFALLAGMLPAIYEKLEIKKHTEEIKAQAGHYKNLENRFIQAAEVVALDEDPKALKFEFEGLMRQMEDLRARPLALPEKYFLEARKKIQAGHYQTDVV